MMIRDALKAADQAQKERERMEKGPKDGLAFRGDQHLTLERLRVVAMDNEGGGNDGDDDDDGGCNHNNRNGGSNQFPLSPESELSQSPSKSRRSRSQSRGRKKDTSSKHKKGLGRIFGGRGRSTDAPRDGQQKVSTKAIGQQHRASSKGKRTNSTTAATATTVNQPGTPTRQRNKTTPNRQQLEQSISAPSSPSSKSFKKFFSRRQTPKTNKHKFVDQQQKQQQQTGNMDSVEVVLGNSSRLTLNENGASSHLELPSLLQHTTTNDSNETKITKTPKPQEHPTDEHIQEPHEEESLINQVAELQRQRDLLDLKLKALDIIKTEKELDDFMKTTSVQHKRPTKIITSSPDHNGCTSLGGTVSSTTNSSANEQDRIIQQQKEEIEALRRQVSDNALKSPRNDAVIPAVIRTDPNMDDSTALTASVFQSKPHSSPSPPAEALDSSNDNQHNRVRNDMVYDFVAEMSWILDPPSRREGYYSGPVNSDRIPSGDGKIRFKNGDMYDGTFVNGQMQGSGGVYMWSTGDVYRGEFWNNLPHGHGEVRTRGGVRYAGSYQFGKLHGFGEKYDSNGDLVYQGQWEYGSQTHAMTPFFHGDATTVGGSEFYPVAADISLAPREDVPMSRYEDPYCYQEAEEVEPPKPNVPECYDVQTYSRRKVEEKKIDYTSDTTSDDDDSKGIGGTSMYAAHLNTRGHFPSTLEGMNDIETMKTELNLGVVAAAAVASSSASNDEGIQGTIQRLREKVALLEQQRRKVSEATNSTSSSH